MQELIRLCKSCTHPLKGRTDKLFCNDNCRNAYHNNSNSQLNNFIRTINHSLLRNRKILESIFTEVVPKNRIGKAALASRGFIFSYYTHTKKNRRGSPVFYCYEYGYTMMANEKIEIQKMELKSNDAY